MGPISLSDLAPSTRNGGADSVVVHRLADDGRTIEGSLVGRRDARLDIRGAVAALIEIGVHAVVAEVLIEAFDVSAWISQPEGKICVRARFV